MEVKKILKQHGLFAQSKLSQSFLHSESVVNRIAEESCLHPYDVVLEIGTGLGILTRALAKKTKKVITVEKDKKLISYLSQEFMVQEFMGAGPVASLSPLARSRSGETPARRHPRCQKKIRKFRACALCLRLSIEFRKA